MFSRRAGLAIALLLAGCNASVDGTSPGVAAGKSIQMGGSADTGCLDGAAQRFADFWGGRSNPEHVGEFFDCASSSLDLFAKRTRGEQAGVWKATELRNFLQAYFVTDFQISDGLLAEAMALKQAILGGTADALTLDELNRARDLLGVLKNESIGLLPYLPLTPESLTARGPTVIDAASLAMLGAAGRVGSVLEQSGQAYPIARLDSLFSEVDQAMRPTVTVFGTIRPYLSWVPIVKELLLGPGGDRIASVEWSTLISTGASWYGWWLQYSELQVHDDWMSGDGLRRLAVVGQGALARLADAVSRHPGEVIGFDELDRVLERAVSAQGYKFHCLMADVSLTRGTLEALLRVVVRRGLGGGESGAQGLGATGLTAAAVARAADKLEHWSDGQELLEAIFDSMPEGRGGEYEPSALLAARAGVPFPESQASEDLESLIASAPRLFDGDDTMFTFHPFLALRRHSFHDLSEQNWMNEAAGVLLKGYAAPGHAAQGVTEDEFLELVNDVTPFFIELKMLDPKNTTVGQQRFREASLFTYAATGGTFMSQEEGKQLLAFMVSGKRLANWAYTDAIDPKVGGCKTGPQDRFDYLTVEPVCFRRNFFDHVEKYYQRLPGMAKYYRSLRPKARAAFELAFEDAARKLRHSDTRYIDSSDTEGYGMVSHYIEAVFSRFDEDGDGTLSLAEAMTAYPVFEPTVVQHFQDQVHQAPTAGEALALYTFLLDRGTQPVQTTLGKADFGLWMVQKPLWSLHSDRGKIVTIFADLSK
jgi:hypothetical protein